MKVIRIYIILSLLIFAFAHSKRSHTKRRRHSKSIVSPNTYIVPVSPILPSQSTLTGDLFRYKPLNDNPDKEKILTEEALKRLLTSLGYKSDDIITCLSKLNFIEKAKTLNSLITVIKTGLLDANKVNDLNKYWGKCPKLNDLSSKIIDRNFSSKMTDVINNISIKKFLKRFLRRFK